MGVRLDDIYQDHALGGDMSEYREYHLSFDLLVIYRIDQSTASVILWRIGSHSKLFG